MPLKFLILPLVIVLASCMESKPPSIDGTWVSCNKGRKIVNVNGEGKVTQFYLSYLDSKCKLINTREKALIVEGTYELGDKLSFPDSRNVYEYNSKVNKDLSSFYTIIEVEENAIYFGQVEKTENVNGFSEKSRLNKISPSTKMKKTEHLHTNREGFPLKKEVNDILINYLIDTYKNISKDGLEEIKRAKVKYLDCYESPTQQKLKSCELVIAFDGGDLIQASIDITAIINGWEIVKLNSRF